MASANATTISRHTVGAIPGRLVPMFILSPSMVLLGLFIIAPAAVLLWYSFTDLSPGRPISFIGLRNYQTLIADRRFWEAALRSVVYVGVTVSLQILVGLIIAVLVDNRIRLRGLWMALLIAPFAVSPIVAVVSWKYLLDPSYGVVNFALTTLGLSRVPWFSTAETSMVAVIIVAVWKGFPFIAVVLFAALRSVPQDIKEAARIDGANALRVFWHIRLPLIMPALAIMALFETIFSLREFDIIQTMTGGGPGTSTMLLSHYLYWKGFGNFNFGLGAAVGWVMMLLTLVLAAIIVWRSYAGGRRRS